MIPVAVLGQFVLVRTIDDVILMLRPPFCHTCTCVAYVDLLTFFAVHSIYDACGFAGSTRFDLHLCAIILIDDCVL